MNSGHMGFDIHIFVCVNERDCQHPLGCCKLKDAENILNQLKVKAKAKYKDMRVRVNKSGCLSFCERGPVVVAYPMNKWFFEVNADQVDGILDEIYQAKTENRIA